MTEPARPVVVAPCDRVRRCYICKKAPDCAYRRFLNPSDPESYVPDCPEHGRMTRDPNRAYNGVRPPSRVCVPASHDRREALADLNGRPTPKAKR